MTKIVTETSDLVKLRADVLTQSKFERNLITFPDQNSWTFRNGAISHKSTGFFHVLGLSSPTSHDENIILYQPQSAITGLLLAKKGDNIWACLQARPEPGNVGIVQYGPTIQSTAANYLKLHGGKDTDFLSHFQSYPGGSTLLSFTMQTDLGELYYQKSKTHNYIEVSDFVTASSNTVWCPLQTICAMSTTDYFLNTDLRSLISMFDWDYYYTGKQEHTPPQPIPDVILFYTEEYVIF